MGNPPSDGLLGRGVRRGTDTDGIHGGGVVLRKNLGDVLVFSPKRIISSSLSKGFIYVN